MSKRRSPSGGGIEIQRFHEAARGQAGFEKFIGRE
jgi:hypothetical protein